MEAFINRWLWIMSLNEIRKLKDSIGKQTIALSNSSSSSNPNNSSTSTSNSHTNSKATDKTALTSPNELPPPSPASSIGSSAGSQSGNTKSHEASVQQQTQFEIMQKTISLYERFSRLNDYNLRSQNFWDTNEAQISDIEYLNGMFIDFCFLC